MIENIHIYQEKEIDENVNIRQKAKSIISKAILKWSNLKIIEENQEEVDVNLKRNSNLYQYNVVNNFRWILTNIFFKDLMKIGSYHKSMQQYLVAVERKKQRDVKLAQVEEKLVYWSYVRFRRNSIQAL